MDDDYAPVEQPSTVEQSPAETHEQPLNVVENPAPVPVSSTSEPPIPGWPQDRFHPVYGRRTFAHPNEYARNGGDDGDWRFKRAADADAARTQTEAELAIAYNQRRLMAEIDAAGYVPVSNSVQAHENAVAGNPEPGIVLPKEG